MPPTDKDVARETPAPGWAPQVGPIVPPVARPEDAERLACAPDRPVCVHAAGPMPGDRPGRALSAARATLSLLEQQGLPGPLPDGGRGGTFGLDVYLSDTAAEAGAYPEMEGRIGHFDRAPAYAVIPTGIAGPDCGFEADVASAVARAALIGLDAAAHQSTLALIGDYLATWVAPCPARELRAIDNFQRHPHRALTVAPPAAATGSYLFAKFLDEVWGTGGIGTVASGLVATSSQQSYARDPAWLLTNEPDFWDALRGVMLDRRSTLGNLLIDFAIRRAFLGNRSDGQHWLDATWLGALGRVRFEWAVDYASLPRRLAPLHEVEPTGSSFVYLDMKGADPHAGLRLIAQWERSYVFQWAIVRLDAKGRELGRQVGGGVFGDDTLQLTMADTDGAAALLIVGTNLGHDDRDQDFDPDAGPPRPAGHTVTLYPL